MARAVVLEQQTLEGFSYSSFYGAYHLQATQSLFTLIADKEYTVVWDGTECVRTAFSYTYLESANCVAVGNPVAAGGEDNGDLFAIVYDTTNDVLHFFSLEDKSSHTVAVYTVDNSGDVVLKDRNGNDAMYSGVESVLLHTADGGMRKFVDVSTIPEDKLPALIDRTITSIAIPDGVTDIGDYIFWACNNLTSVIIPASVTRICQYAFRSCSSLTSIIIPASVTNIDHGAFLGCSSLTSVIFEDPTGWSYRNLNATQGSFSSSDLANPSTAATMLTDTHRVYYWYKE